MNPGGSADSSMPANFQNRLTVLLTLIFELGEIFFHCFNGKQHLAFQSETASFKRIRLSVFEFQKNRKAAIQARRHWCEEFRQ